MRKGPGGIDEFKIARAFGAVAVMVALYGVTLSATALVEQPVARSAQPLRWYEQTEPAKVAETVDAPWAQAMPAANIRAKNHSVTRRAMWGISLLVCNKYLSEVR